MAERVLRKGITRIFNPRTQGAVASGRFLTERKTGIAGSLVPPGADLEPVRADWYQGQGPVVSIEEAAERELTIKEELDKQWEMENQGVSSESVVQKGLPPCKRVNTDPRL